MRSRKTAGTAEFKGAERSALRTIPCRIDRALSAALRTEVKVVHCTAGTIPASDDVWSVNCLDLLLRDSDNTEIVS